MPKIPVRFADSSAATPAPAEPQMRWRLRVADRCDRCGAQAFALAVVNGVDLMFCGHHFARHEDALRAVASEVVDERARINRKPTPTD